MQVSFHLSLPRERERERESFHGTQKISCRNLVNEHLWIHTASYGFGLDIWPHDPNPKRPIICMRLDWPKSIHQASLQVILCGRTKIFVIQSANQVKLIPLFA